MERTKESAMKAIAKRPKLFPLLMKGGHSIHELKKIGQCSGGLIRSLIWSGVAVLNEDRTIKFVKGIKQSDLPSMDEAPKKKDKAEKAPKKGKVKEKGKAADKGSKVKEKPASKLKKKEVDPEDEEDEIEEAETAEKAAKKDIKKTSGK